MLKASRLLYSCQTTHCVAHALHLLLVKDGVDTVYDVKCLIEKCSEIVTKLHFRGCELQNEKQNLKDVQTMDKIMMMMSEAFELLEADGTSPVSDNTEDTTDNSVHTAHRHESLKKSVVTRWSSILHMVSSILDNAEAIDKLLLRQGLRELRLDDDEKVLLSELKDFLAPFELFTQMVSSSGAMLSLVPLIRAEVYDNSLVGNDKLHPAIIQLKRAVNSNVDKRLPITHAIKMASLFDPSTKNSALGFFSEPDDPEYQGYDTNPAIVARITDIAKKEYIELFQSEHEWGRGGVVVSALAIISEGSRFDPR